MADSDPPPSYYDVLQEKYGDIAKMKKKKKKKKKRCQRPCQECGGQMIHNCNATQCRTSKRLPTMPSCTCVGCGIPCLASCQDCGKHGDCYYATGDTQSPVFAVPHELCDRCGGPLIHMCGRVECVPPPLSHYLGNPLMERNAWVCNGIGCKIRCLPICINYRSCGDSLTIYKPSEKTRKVEKNNNNKCHIM